MGNLLARIQNWKTTLAGTAVGLVGAAIFHNIATQAGCHFDQVIWSDVAVFAGSQIMGAIATDNGKAV